jgi:hypothetical protein
MTSTSLQGVTILTNNNHSRCLEKLESHTTVFLHPSGYRVRLRQIRDGLELSPITGDNNYDPNYQEYRRFQNLVHVHRVSIVKHFILSRSAFIRHCCHEFLKYTCLSSTNILKPEVMGATYQDDCIAHEFCSRDLSSV